VPKSLLLSNLQKKKSWMYHATRNYYTRVIVVDLRE
jgi:hypothetical protein